MNLVTVKPGQWWSSYANPHSNVRTRFEIMAVHEDRQIAAVRYASGRGGTKSLKTLERGLRGSRLESEGDGTAPKVRQPRRITVGRSGHFNTLAERSTASDHRKLIPPRWMSAAQKKAWREENAR